jgi:hypothetical protein
VSPLLQFCVAARKKPSKQLAYRRASALNPQFFTAARQSRHHPSGSKALLDDAFDP